MEQNPPLVIPTVKKLLIVTLDRLRPFDLNPRVTRNPKYGDIKSSILMRGLDNPPSITHRPGDPWFIIANGGNTRLSILNELWLETGKERFWRIHCYFDPWPDTDTLPRGNLKCLVGHLAEGGLHSQLTFVEQALGIMQARELHEQETGAPVSQSRLARLLKEEGYPVSQSSISRMEQTLTWLYPAIPEPLLGGLGRPQIEKLLALRLSAKESWDKYHDASQQGSSTFDEVFAKALSAFNGPLAGFSVTHVNDELLGLMSQSLDVDYNLLVLETDRGGQQWRSVPEPIANNALPPVSGAVEKTVSSPDRQPVALQKESHEKAPATFSSELADSDESVDGEDDATEIGETVDSDSVPPSFTHESDGDRETPAGPCVSDDEIWAISPLFDYLDSLYSMADRAAWDLAATCLIEETIVPASPEEPGVGFTVTPLNKAGSNEARLCWQLLDFLSRPATGPVGLWQSALLGSEAAPAGWNDEFMIKALRLIRLVRRIREQQRQEGVV